MIGRRLAVCTFSVLAIIPSLSGATDDALKIEVERPVLASYKVQSPTINANLKLTFDARFTNQGDAPLEVPDRVSAGRVAGISKHGLEAQQSDGNWRTVEGGGDLMWRGDTVFPTCKLLKPKETFDLKGVSGPFVVFRSNLAALLGTTATLRLYLVLPCKQRDGNITLGTAKTDPFVLSIPAAPSRP